MINDIMLNNTLSTKKVGLVGLGSYLHMSFKSVKKERQQEMNMFWLSSAVDPSYGKTY
jgi:hypothetical protein